MDTSVGTLVVDALVARHASLLPAVEISWKAKQGSASDFCFIEGDAEGPAPNWSDKDQKANEVSVALQYWGSSPRTLQGYAKTLIDSLLSNPLSITGVTHLRTAIDANAGSPRFQVKGQAAQFMRRVQIRFFLQPQ